MSVDFIIATERKVTKKQPSSKTGLGPGFAKMLPAISLGSTKGLQPSAAVARQQVKYGDPIVGHLPWK